MTDILDVMQRLQETEEALSKARTVAAQNPDRKSLSITVNSLRKRYSVLEAQFSSLAAQEHLDVCTYRLISRQGRHYSVSSLASALGDFQSLVTLVYDAIKSGEKKDRATWSADIAAESSLDFGYTYNGSLGFVFTMPNERLLAVDSFLDMSFSTIFEMAKSQSPDELSKYAKQLGVAPIRKIYNWASDHLKAGLSAEIIWRRDQEVRSSLIIQEPELQQLCDAIDKTSETREKRFTITGILLGGDIKTKSFHFEPDDGEEIKGALSDTFKSEDELRLGHRYSAEILRTTKIFYSTDKEETHNYLIKLE